MKVCVVKSIAIALSLFLCSAAFYPVNQHALAGSVSISPNVPNSPAFNFTFPNAPPSAGKAFNTFADWLKTSPGEQALSLYPVLASFQGQDFSTQAGREIILPLLKHLPNGFHRKLKAITTIKDGKENELLEKLVEAHSLGKQDVEQSAAQATAMARKQFSQKTADTQSLEDLRAKLSLFSLYGNVVRKHEKAVSRMVFSLKSKEMKARVREIARQLKLPVRTFTLDNGLKVVVQTDRGSPSVATSLTYKVGSVDEKPGISGMAHLFEHLMSQGTRNIAPRQISQIIAANGGIRNASTGKGRTQYWSAIPKGALETVLWLEADRMQNWQPDERALALEKQVVLEEMRWRDLNQPYQQALDSGMGEVAYGKWKNAHTIIGSVDDVSNVKLAKVKKFHDAYYAPNNAVLSLVGDVSLYEAKRLVKRYFGHIPSKPVAPAPDLTEPPLASDKNLEFHDPLAKLPRLFMGWRAPERGSRSFWALNLLMKILSNGEANPLHQVLVKSARTALIVNGYFPWWKPHYEPRGPHIFGLDIMMKTGTTVEMITEKVCEVLGRFSDEGPLSEELDRAKAQAEFAWNSAVQSLYARANLLGSYTAFIGHPKRLAYDLQRMLSITPAEIRRAAKRWILESKRAMVHVIPSKAKPPQKKKAPPPKIPPETPRPEAKETPPPAKATNPPPIPNLHRFTLSNGLRVVVVKDSRLPLVEARLSFAAGKTAARRNESGIAEAMGELLLKGTDNRDASELSQILAKLGFSLDVQLLDDEMLLAASGISRNAEGFFKELGGILTRASYPKEEVELWKENMIEKLKALRADAGFLMIERLNAELYGKHPYGRPSPNEETISAITSEKLRRFHRRQVTPQGALLVVTGDIEPEAAQESLENSLREWKSKSTTTKVPEIPKSGASRFALVDRPGSKQANLALAQTIPIRPDHPDFLALSVMNGILGGGDTSRLFVNLRVKNGYTYGSYSKIYPSQKCLVWNAKAETRDKVSLAAFQEMIKEIHRIRDELVSNDTLEAAKHYLTGIFALRLASTKSTADYIWTKERFNLDAAEEFGNYLRRLEALTPEDIQRVAQKYLKPERMVAVAVGDKRNLQSKLKAFNPGKR